MKKIKKETKVNTGKTVIVTGPWPRSTIQPNEPVYKYIIVDGQVKKAKEEKTSHNKVYFTEYQEKDVQVFETEQEARTALLEQKIAKIEKSVLRFFL